MAIGNRCFTDISMNTFNYKGAVTTMSKAGLLAGCDSQKVERKTFLWGLQSSLAMLT